MESPECLKRRSNHSLQSKYVMLRSEIQKNFKLQKNARQKKTTKKNQQKHKQSGFRIIDNNAILVIFCISI